MRWVRILTGLMYGTVTGLLELVAVATAGLVLAVTLLRLRAHRKARSAIDRAAGKIAAIELRRIHRYMGPVPEAPEPNETTRNPTVRGQAVGYLATRAWVGILGGLVLALLLFGLATVLSMFAAWAFGFPYPLISETGGVKLGTILMVAAPGLVLLFLNVTGLHGVVVLDRRLAASMLGTDNSAEYRRRIAELARSRAGVVDAVNDERRRIERTLHDGVQQHIVMLRLLIGRARHSSDPDQQAELMQQAHTETQRALDELRETAWRIYPSVLDTGGLRAALDTVAERTAIPLTIHDDLSSRPPRSYEALAYFLISEAVTNAAKHSGASRIEIQVGQEDDTMRISIIDDGVGGADPAGGGLSGLAGRISALDGRFTVDSPVGGPTSILAELPCAAAKWTSP